MKTLAFTVLLAFTCHFCSAQNRQDIDSLKHELAIAQNDTIKMQIRAGLCMNYRFGSPDSSFFYGNKALELSRKLKYPKGELTALSVLMSPNISIDIAKLYKNKNQSDSSIFYAKKGLKEAITIQRQTAILESATFLSELYEPIDLKQSHQYLKLAQNYTALIKCWHYKSS